MTSPRYTPDFTRRVFGTPPRHEEKTMRPETEKASREYIREIKMRDFAGEMYVALNDTVTLLQVLEDVVFTADETDKIHRARALLSRIEAAMGDDFHSEPL